MAVMGIRQCGCLFQHEWPISTYNAYVSCCTAYVQYEYNNKIENFETLGKLIVGYLIGFGVQVMDVGSGLFRTTT